MKEFINYDGSHFNFVSINTPYKIDRDGGFRYRIVVDNNYVKFSGKLIFENNTYTTFKDGCFHSYNDEPSGVNAFGTKFWYKHGWLHRETGPSLIYADGVNRWYLNDKEYSFNEYLLRIEPDIAVMLALEYNE